jgi:hypothetical protein
MNKPESIHNVAPDTAVFFSNLSHLSAQPGGVSNLRASIEHLATQPDTASTFLPIYTFDIASGWNGFEDAINNINCQRPEGIPVDVVNYDHTAGAHQVVPGELVALLGTNDHEHGAYNGLAVANFGSGPQVIDVSLRAGVPGITYLVV